MRENTDQKTSEYGHFFAVTDAKKYGRFRSLPLTEAVAGGVL